MDGCLNLGPSEIGYHVHLEEHSTRVGVLLFAVLHHADESQQARNSCPRLPHSVDSRFGLYHVAVVLSFLLSPALHKFDSPSLTLFLLYEATASNFPLDGMLVHRRVTPSSMSLIPIYTPE